jgi:long-chain fatty acid transport protein
MTRTLARLLVCASALSLSTAAMAGGFNVRSQSAVGNGMAHAGAGTSAWGASSMFWNPAAITAVPGRQSEFNASLIMPQIDILLDAPVPGRDSGNIGVISAVPASFNTWQINERLWIGMNTGAPFGSETEPSPAFAAFGANAGSKVFSLAATPTVGLKVNDWMSIGAGVTVQYFKVDLKSVAAGPTPVRLKGDAFGVGFTAGVNFTPWQGGSIGIGYRSPISHDLEGSLTPLVPVAISAKITLPETVTLGIRQDLNEQWSVMGTAQWTNWSRVDTVGLTTAFGPVPAPASPLLFRYEDEYMFSLGAEYRHNANWTFRAGVAYEKSPITDANRGLRVVDGDRIWASIGAGYKISERFSADVSYSHLFVKDGRLAPAIASGLTGSTSGSADIVSVALRYRWDAPATDETLITK